MNLERLYEAEFEITRAGIIRDRAENRGRSTTAHRHFANNEERDEYFRELQAARVGADAITPAPAAARHDPEWLVPTADQYVEQATKKLRDL